jgi:hypothetical protein
MVTKSSGDPLSLIAYQGVDLYRYAPRAITDTLILIDNTYVCHAAGALDEKEMGNTVSTVWCSDDPILIQQTQKNINRLFQRSTPYLQ